MVLRKYYFDTAVTAGTKILAANSGMVMPKGYSRIGHIWANGVNHESVKITFPKGGHEFNEEEIPVQGEIIVETLVEPIGGPFPHGGMAWCGWSLPEGEELEFDFDGVEAGGDATLMVEFLRADDNYGIYGAPPLHWGRGADVTYGTTANNATLYNIPAKCKKLMWAACHGAGMGVFPIKFEHGGTVHPLVGNHGAIDACVTLYAFQYCNLDLPSRRIYYHEDAAVYAGTALAASYFAFSY